jgi:hypothetical protein
MDLKGQSNEIFDPWFFHQSTLPMVTDDGNVHCIVYCLQLQFINGRSTVSVRILRHRNPKFTPEAGISINLGHPQGRALKSTLNFLGRIPCLSLIGIDL